MHPEAFSFLNFVKNSLPEYFINKKVLDVGSGDINGNLRELFKNCEYHGNDVVNAPNVTIVSKTKDLIFDNNYFDIIISSECFEHDPEYSESMKNIYRMLKPNGLFCFTCAGINRPEHGTKKTTPHDSYGTMGGVIEMQDYYKNLELIDVNKVLNLNEHFKYWDAYYNYSPADFYFLSIKKGDEQIPVIPIYNYNNVVSYNKNTLSIN
jgi:SAM-dependent methyltransferase